MSEGELVFTDGSSMKGSYQISHIGTRARQLIFVANDFSTDSFFKKADFLRSITGNIVALELKKTNVGAKNQILTIYCEFLEKE
jgi:hypothetical protein